VNPLSIGNFFHEDLAYLAALQEAGHVSEDVERKQAAWWKLLVWYLNDDLKEIEQPLQGQPFLKWIPKRGGRADAPPAFDRITWLERDNRIVGVVSPVLLVRPLPDEDLNGNPWKTRDAPMTERVRRRLAALVSNLSEESSAATQRNDELFCGKLVPIIAAHGVTTEPGAGENVITARFSFLDPYTLRSSEVLVPRGEGTFLIPRCDSCRAPMLPATAPIAFDSDHALFACPQCGTGKRIALSDFGCAWVDGELVVWRDRALQWADEKKSMPPAPTIDQEQRKVTFAYPAVSILATVTDRTLTFELPSGATIRPIERILDINYPNFLWPGDPDAAAPVTATALPVRIENARLVSSAQAKKIGSNVEVTVGFKGLPGKIRWIFIPSEIATSAIAIYPNPKEVPPQWSWFDIATDATLQIKGRATSARSLGPHRVRAEVRAVDLPAVELTNGRGSCSLFLSRVDSRPPQAPIDVAMGFDFGSSNTALRFSLDGTSDNSRPLTGAELRRFVAPLTVSAQMDEAADRLAPTSAVDNASFQSLHCQEHHVARVVALPCCSQMRRGDVLFKSDPQWRDVRIEYLSEMLIHGLIGATRHLGARPLNVSGVFSYPLTFTKTRLGVFEREMAKVIEEVARRTGGDPEASNRKAKFVDEATAGVHSLGDPQAKEVVLTADLGGGTLDISIGRAIDGRAKDQIGSIEVGGSYFLKQGLKGDELEDYATAATSIARGKVEWREWLKRKAQVDRYYQLLFIALETVLGSYITRRGADQQVPMVTTLYPLGNGWRFYELMVDPKQDEPAAFVRSEIERLARNLASAIETKYGVKLDMTPKFVPNPKEAVASGCLGLATMSVEINTSEVAPRLPVGITSSNSGNSVPWHELFVGDAAQEAFVNNGIEFDERELRTRLQTPNGKSWADAPIDAGKLRSVLQTEEYRSHRGYERGPLQLLLEKQWLPKV
jgi:predicted RNA-binding Zn-ribbon protein involved in translation (DUF1610 family)